jgi:Nickel/cobalt transporter regulator
MGRSDNRARALHGTMIMKKTLALAALLAATAFTPVLAQEEPRQGRRMATAEEPTPAPLNAELRVAQRERGERGERGPRVDNGNGEARPQWNGGQGRAEGGWQRQQQAAPVAQTSAAPVQVEQSAPAPAQRQWNGGEGGQRNWQGQQRPDGNGGQRRWQGQADQRQTPPVAAAPTQPQGNWPNREQRRDTWRSNGANNGAVVTQRQDGRRQEGRDWNGNSGWNGQTRTDGQWNGNRRNDTWQNNDRNQGRNDHQWNGNGRNDTWRNDTWRNDSRNDRRYDQRSQWQNQYRNWNLNWNRDWRRDQRYDWQRYRYSNRGLFSSNAYYAPYGWDYGYRRFSIGFSLSYLLYDQQYWLDDPYSYRLPPADGPYRWVRYYDDVLLVDLRSGQVVDAIYDFFE